jgi:hypothetical protein
LAHANYSTVFQCNANGYSVCRGLQIGRKLKCVKISGILSEGTVVMEKYKCLLGVNSGG